MSEYRFTKLAARDLEGIAKFTIERFGLDQARRYRDELRLCFEKLAEHPRLGQRAEHLGVGLRRHEHGSHIVFYQSTGIGVLIARILHRRMDARGRL